MFERAEVEIVERAPVRVALLRDDGLRGRLPERLAAFRAWRRAAGYGPELSATYNIFRRGPGGRALIDLCAGIEGAVGGNAQGVVAGEIAGGRHARLRVTGQRDLWPAAMYLAGRWLPGSGAAARQAPVFAQRLELAGSPVADLFLPIM